MLRLHVIVVQNATGFICVRICVRIYSRLDAEPEWQHWRKHHTMLGHRLRESDIAVVWRKVTMHLLCALVTPSYTWHMVCLPNQLSMHMVPVGWPTGSSVWQ